jgi:hypothetical protein
VSRTIVRRLAALISIAATVATCSGPGPTPLSNLDTTGILLVGVGEQVQSRPPNEAFAQAFSDAMQLAEANGVDLGYPFIDPVSGELVVSAATPRRTSTACTVQPRTQTTRQSIQRHDSGGTPCQD